MLPTHVMTTLYNTLILTHLSYCCMVWGNTFKTHLHRLFITQKKALRTVCNAPFNCHTNHLFSECKILTISDLVLMYTYSFMYQYNSNTLPDIFNGFFHTNAYYHSHFTRQYADLHQFLPKTTISQNSLRCNRIKLWNNLDSDIKLSKTVNKFKKLLKNDMLVQYKSHPI